MRINYKEQKVLSAEEMSQKEISCMVRKASLQLQADLLASESALEDKKNKLAEVKTTYPLNVQDVINIQLDIEALEDGIKRTKCLQKELGL